MVFFLSLVNFPKSYMNVTDLYHACFIMLNLKLLKHQAFLKWLPKFLFRTVNVLQHNHLIVAMIDSHIKWYTSLGNNQFQHDVCLKAIWEALIKNQVKLITKKLIQTISKRNILMKRKCCFKSQNFPLKFIVMYNPKNAQSYDALLMCIRNNVIILTLKFLHLIVKTDFSLFFNQNRFQ